VAPAHTQCSIRIGYEAFESEQRRSVSGHGALCTSSARATGRDAEYSISGRVCCGGRRCGRRVGGGGDGSLTCHKGNTACCKTCREGACQAVTLRRVGGSRQQHWWPRLLSGGSSGREGPQVARGTEHFCWEEERLAAGTSRAARKGLMSQAAGYPRAESGFGGPRTAHGARQPPAGRCRCLFRICRTLVTARRRRAVRRRLWRGRK
jgi:hypothetical protein